MRKGSMKKSTLKQVRNRVGSRLHALLSLICLVGLAYTPSTEAVVFVHFEEIGDDVRVSFSGTLDLDNLNGTLTADFVEQSSPVAEAAIGIFLAESDFFLFSFVGSSAFSSPRGFTNNPDDIGPGTFGFSDSVLLVDVGSVLSQTPELATFEADPSRHFFFLRNQTLASIQADSANIQEGFVLWTANGTGDTFVFTRQPVPEPSSIALLGLGGFLLTRRRHY